jgi:hypothetical protein
MSRLLTRPYIRLLDDYLMPLVDLLTLVVEKPSLPLL